MFITIIIRNSQILDSNMVIDNFDLNVFILAHNYHYHQHIKNDCLFKHLRMHILKYLIQANVIEN